MTFWTIQEYCNGTNSWGDQVIKLLAPPPATPVSCSPSTITQGQTLNITLTGTSSSGSAFFNPPASYPNHIAAAFGGTGLTINSITFSDGTHITLNVSAAPAAPAGAQSISVTNPDGQSASSAGGVLTVIAAPPPPPGSFSLSTPANGATNQSQTPTLTWTAASGANTYTVVVANDSLLSSPVLTQTGIVGTSFNVPPATLAQGQTYYWGVTAVNTGGSTASTPVSFSFATAPPPPPGAFNLSTPADSSSGVSLTPTLTWTGASGADTYTAIVATDPGLSSVVVSQSGLLGTFYNVPAATLNYSTTYYWGVVAVNANGNTSSTPVSFSFTTAAPPPPPGAFSLSTPADTSTGVSLTPTLTWTGASGVDTYTAVVATDPGLSSVVVSQSGIVGTSYNVPGATLNYSTTYYWGVTAVNANGSTASTPTSFSFVTIPPPCPGDINGDGHTNTIDLGILLAHFGQSVTPNTNGDLNGDGVVNTLDLAVVLNNFGC